MAMCSIVAVWVRFGAGNQSLSPTDRHPKSKRPDGLSAASSLLETGAQKRIAPIKPMSIEMYGEFQEAG